MSKRALSIQTRDGAARAWMFSPDGRPAENLPGVLFYMDVWGPRPALDGMAQRLADQGYTVLLPDLFYRFGDYGPYDLAQLRADPDERAAILGRIGQTSHAQTRSDGEAFIAALEKEAAPGPIGVVGYCMGGARALTAAGAFPDAIGAVASFHGAHLASDAPDSPHHLAPAIAGRVYVGCAGEDETFPPEQSSRLSDALRRAKVDFTLENYQDCTHGWTVPDQAAFDPEGAERHWARLTTLFAETLKR